MAKSLQQFREWSVKQGGNIGNPSTGSYKGQCVSLIQQYINQVFGVPYAARGHAKDFVPPTFKKIALNSALKPGDVMTYDARFGGGYGHIEMIDDTGLALGQNRNFNGKVTRGAVLKGYSALYRPTKPFTIKTSGGTDVIAKGDKKQMRAVMRDIKGWNAKNVDAGKHDASEANAWAGQTWVKYIAEAVDEGKAYRTKREKALAYYAKKAANDKALKDAKAAAKTDKDKLNKQIIQLTNEAAEERAERSSVEVDLQEAHAQLDDALARIKTLEKQKPSAPVDEQQVVQNWLLRLWNSLFKRGE